MTRTSTRTDISSELLLARHGQGIRLVRPDRRIHAYENLYSVSDILQLPINTYFLDTESKIQQINPVATQICGFTSAHDAIDRTVEEYASKPTAHDVMQNDQKTFRSQQFSMTEDTIQRGDDVSLTALTLRFPWYERNKLIGMLGIAIVHSHSDIRYLTDNLLMLSSMGLVGPQLHKPDQLLAGSIINDVYLDRRETEILRIFSRKSTAKQIGRQLGISHRTVEYHLDKLRLKTKTRSKSELIAWSHQYFGEGV
jgi:DNA-binding CsgD family transcriptional regulator